MKLGLQIPDFTWPGGPAELGATLAKVARTADDAGFEFIGVMDHLFQIRSVGSDKREMLEAYTTLGYLAGHTSRAKLLAIVTGAPYRFPGMLAKIVTSLDVLSSGRAWLGIGAAWNESEARALGIPFPPLAERFERLEETIQICLQMWSEEEGAFEGKHYQLARTLNSPQSLSRPHPPILIGGMGERKTLRLVARYAQACNLFPTPELPRKLEVLRRYCEEEGRDYASIEKTSVLSFDANAGEPAIAETVRSLQSLANAGIQRVFVGVTDVHTLTPLDILAERVMPAVAD